MADSAATRPPPSARRVHAAFAYVADRRGAAIVTVVLLAATLAGSLAVRSVIRDQEKRLLVERASEIATLISSASSTTHSMLDNVGEDALAEGPTGTRFIAAAAAATALGGSVGVAQLRGGTYQVIASRGLAGGAASVPSPPLIAEALAATDFVSALTQDSSGRRVTTVLRIPASVPTIAYTVTALIPNHPAPTTSSSPYRELDVAIYASSRPDPRLLLLVSGANPAGTNPTSAKVFAYGSNSWILVAAARQPLVGGFAASFPWLVLGGGLLATALAAMMMNLLSRRRTYAMRLVEERTRTLRVAQEAAEAANRAKSEFISRMSHELRTPLNAILGFGQVLQLYEDLTEQQHAAVKHITTGGRHLLDLINEILDISQVESGRLTLSPEPVEVGDLIEEVAQLLAPVAADSSVQLVKSEAGQLERRFVFADHQRLKQVMLNVVGNAIKYNRPGGLVSIHCEEQTAGQLRIMVTDTGLGIAPSQMPLLFTPFERLGAERTNVEGTGMGLSLSRNLVEAMSGTMGCDSEVGSGSTFWVELPIVEGQVDRYHRLDKTKREPEPPAVPTLLHVEDNLSNVELVERVLTNRPGIRLLAAMQGSVGLQLAREHRPSLILLDLNLPDVSGERILASLREDPRTARIPVAIVSADATQRQVQRLLSSGARWYLTKPIDVEELLRIIDSTCTPQAPAPTAGVNT
jgi:signal transduction histidine kinase/ActR/RegA family two-component response regulator